MGSSLRVLSIAAALVLPNFAQANDDLLGGVHKGTYGRGTFETISEDRVSVRSARLFGKFTYDLSLTELESDGMVRCILLANNDSIITHQQKNPGRDRQLALYFSVTEQATKVVCQQYLSNRQMRPHTGADDI